MSKVLISFLGTGSLVDNRSYRKAKYHFSDGTEYESSFVAKALRDYYEVDKLILVGTVKSMWEEVYLTFSNNPDDDYWIQLHEHCQNANHKSPLSLPDIDKIEDSIGKGSKVVLIRYGLNEEELSKNAEIILGLEQYLNKNDELYVDITHSFRSLPLFLMNTLVYLQNVSQKKISVKHITYGMLDVTSEMKYTPVVELDSIMQMNKWITGAYSFQEFGNAYQIAELIGDKSQEQRLKKFSDLMNLNHLAGVEKQRQELSAFKNAEYQSPFAQMLVAPIVKDFIDYFDAKTHSEFQLKLAQWHFDHMNYSSSYIDLTEAIITYVCEQMDLDWDDYSKRIYIRDMFTEKAKATEEAKVTGDAKATGKPKNTRKTKGAEKSKVTNDFNAVVDKELLSIYMGTNGIRNSIAHTKESKQNHSEMIDRLENNLNKISRIITSK